MTGDAGLASVDGVVVRVDEPLSRHTALRTGGTVDAFVLVHRRESLGAALDALKVAGLSWTLLGAGTRTVGRDGGLAGAILKLGTEFSTIRRDGPLWVVGGSTPVPALVAAAGEKGGACGSVGASVLLDEGWEVEAVRFFARGRERDGSLDECRKAKGIVVEVRLRSGRPGKAPSSPWFPAQKKASVREILERTGLSGVRLRDVAMPEVAPEALVNLGRATARDLQLLHASAIERVRRETGLDLAPRVSWLGRNQ